MCTRRSILIFSLLICCAAQTLATDEERPLVQTSLGSLRGTWLTSSQGKKYAAFMAVPFAKPPLGDLRFQPPEEVNAWEGEWDAGSEPPLCLTWDHIMAPFDTLKVKGQEDCLYLNVYTPELPRDSHDHLKDVIVWFHAGAFMFGTSSIYGAKKLMDRGVVLVTVNYRLGPLGFLSFEDDVLPGNNGMRDQVAALQWVKRHVSNFGGNPESVTIMGMSAGGSSVHLHFLSPLSRGLFRGGVSMSGTALCRWVLAEDSREKALQIASSLGCPTDGGSNAILKCLRQRPAHAIVAQVEQFQVWQYNPFAPFGPVVERRHQTLPPFLPDTPANMLTRGEFAYLPWVTGVTKAEGIYPAGQFVMNPTEMSRLWRDFDLLAPFLLDYNRTVTPELRDVVSSKIRDHYLGDTEETDQDAPDKVIKMVKDRMFAVDAQRAAEMHSRFAPAWFYHFTYRGEHSLSDLLTGTKRNFGTSHADDVSYFLNVSYIPDEVPRQDLDRKVELQMQDLWISFAKTGEPRCGAGPVWEPVKFGGELEHLEIDGAPAHMTSTSDLGDAHFWESLPLQETHQSPALAARAIKDEL